MVRPDPRGKYFPLGDGGGGGGGGCPDFLRDIRLKIENYVNLLVECFVFIEVETHIYTLLNM